MYQWILPAAPLSDDIVIITIGDEDVRLLDGWPISRDYYSYAIYAANLSGAKAIGLDIFFSGPDKRYPRYDSTMADFLTSSGNVVLPMFFSELKNENSEIVGIDPHNSISIISKSAAANGFSNLGSDAVIYQLPLSVNSSEGTQYSFATALARIFNEPARSGNDADANNLKAINEDVINHTGSLYINYPDFEDIEQRYSFVNFLQIFRNEPEKLDFEDKIVVIINSVTGVAQIKSTPLKDQVPASFIHIAALNNLIKHNWLNVLHPLLGLIIIFVLGLFCFIRWRINLAGMPININYLICIGYAICALGAALLFNLLFPLIYPLVTMIIAGIMAKVAAAKENLLESGLFTSELDRQLNEKENQLESTRDELKELHSKLFQEKELSEKNKEEIEQQKQSIADLEKELADLQTYRNPIKRPEQVDDEGMIYAKTSIMKEVMELVAKVSTDDIPVLITGETGTGKEVIAQIIHKRSKRNSAPFVAVNCGALPETLLESELFGHERGSFTGATSLRKGRFELAEGGTVFLDEVTETSPAFQSRLLRILQESKFERVGGQKEIHSDVRIIAATNKNIQHLIDKEEFRSDLFYRLNGFPINVPPLRERIEDIGLLADHFIKKHGYKDISGFSSQAIKVLNVYSWPGNVRELENCIRRAAILAQSEGRSMIQEDDLPEDIKKAQETDRLQMVHKPLEDQILDLMRTFKFSRSAVTQTANLLGNRDRGTITEYVKGICFRQIVESELNIAEAINTIAGSADEILLENIQQKIKDYLTNLKNYSGLPAQADIPANEQAPPYRGLPKKFDPFLDQILANLPLLLEQI